MDPTVDIQIKDNQSHFYTGDKVSGTAEVSLPENIPLASVEVSYHCLGEVNWVEYHGTPRYMDSCVFYDQQQYHEEVLKIDEKSEQN